jgi:hypothetical protein
VAPAADGCLACCWNCCGCTKETFCLLEPSGRPRLFAGAGAAGMGATRGLFAEPSALAFWSAVADLASLSWGVNCLKKLLMLGWLWKDILWACQALLISTRLTPPRKRSKKGSLHARQREAFFGAKRSGFGGERSLQKSKSHLFAQ